jgi:Gluconate 2-dehydrogenase subunit 3
VRDIAGGGHLPNLRPGRRPPDKSWLPRQRRGVTPQMIGRYPDYDVMESAGSWDEATRRVVSSRLDVAGPLQFFSAAEEPTLRAFCDTCLAQDEEPRVPVAEMVDRKLHEGKLDGYQYADMPDDRETWHLVLRGLEETARRRYGAPFTELDAESRDAIVDALSRGWLHGDSWDHLHAKRAWSVCMRAMLSEFYSHPWAWNEIGFGGPAYPRGFMRLGPLGAREPHERPGATDEDPVRVTERWER